jgi:hypothetical protein
VYAEENKRPVAASRKNTRSMCIKPKMWHYCQRHSTAQPKRSASKRLPAAQGRLVIFASYFHMLAVAHPTCRASTSLINSSVSSARNSTRSPPRRDSVALGPMLARRSLYPLCSTRKP